MAGKTKTHSDHPVKVATNVTRHGSVFVSSDHKPQERILLHTQWLLADYYS